MFSKVAKLERLLKMKELGVLSEEDFNQRKQAIIDAKSISPLVYVIPLVVVLVSAVGFGAFKYNQTANDEQRKLQEAELPIPMVSYKKENKLVWEWTSGYTYTNFGGFWGGNNSAEVSQACRNESASVSLEESNGWKIVSSNPADKNVQGGSCKGRDIMIERESPSVIIS